MIKYYKNYKRGDRDAAFNISAKLNAENAEKCGSPNDFAKEPNNKLDLHEAAVEEYNDMQPSVIPVDDDPEDHHDVGDENAIGRYHTEGAAHAEMNPGSFVHSEEEDGVDGLPEESNDATNLPSVFANATERPRALTIHDTNVQNKAQQRKSTLMAGPKATATPRSSAYGTNPA